MGCADKEPKLSKSAFVVVVSKDIKFSDMGFFNEYENKKSLDVYALGSPIFRIDFDDMVCLGPRCISKGEFVKEYISKALYPDAMNDILSQKPLKIDSKITTHEGGFVQEALSSDYDLIYKVDKKEIYFFERIGGFKFHLRFID